MHDSFLQGVGPSRPRKGERYPGVIAPCVMALDIWVFPKIGVSQNGWFIMENPIRMDDLGVPLFLETPI